IESIGEYLVAGRDSDMVEARCDEQDMILRVANVCILVGPCCRKFLCVGKPAAAKACRAFRHFINSGAFYASNRLAGRKLSEFMDLSRSCDSSFLHSGFESNGSLKTW